MREREKLSRYIFLYPKKKRKTTTTIIGRISGRRASNETKFGPIEAPENTDPDAVTMEQELGPQASIPGDGKGTPARGRDKAPTHADLKGGEPGRAPPGAGGLVTGNLRSPTTGPTSTAYDSTFFTVGERILFSGAVTKLLLRKK